LYKLYRQLFDFLEKKATRHEMSPPNWKKHKNCYKRELDWVRRMPKARTTKAKSRVDAFYDLKEKFRRKRVEGEIQIDIKGTAPGQKNSGIPQYRSKSGLAKKNRGRLFLQVQKKSE
jgi:ATP-binding cassette subfamily F protein uup